MVNIKFYLVSNKECRDRVVDNLTEEEIKSVCCYGVNEKYPKDDKNFSKKINRINEWELSTFNSIYQDLHYCEYSMIPHCYYNESLNKNITHIGMLHNDVRFEQNSISNIYNILNREPNTIFYNLYFRDRTHLYFSRPQLDKICEYMSGKLNMFINAQHIWNTGWIGAMCLAPTEVFKKFGKFIHENHEEYHYMLSHNTWSLQDYTNKHSPCGFVERMWGFYLVSLGMPMKQMDVIHERDFYKHDYGHIN